MTTVDDRHQAMLKHLKDQRDASRGVGVATGGDGPQPPGMDTRVSALEAYMKDVKASLGRIEGALGNLPTQTQIAALPTREGVRNTALAITGVVLAAMVGIGGLLLAASGNQLSAFQAGLSSVEAIVASRQPLPALGQQPAK